MTKLEHCWHCWHRWNWCAVFLLLLAPWGLQAAQDQHASDAAQAWADLQTKAALNGQVQASVSYQGQNTQVFISSKKRYTRTGQQAQVLQAARLIQRDVAVFCGQHCQALPMPEPRIQLDGQLHFVLRFTGLGRQLFQEELQALLSGNTGLPAAQLSNQPSTTQPPQRRLKSATKA
jgi:hypothetical protein